MDCEPIGRLRGSPPYVVEAANPAATFFMISDGRGVNMWSNDKGQVFFLTAEAAEREIRSHGHEPG